MSHMNKICNKIIRNDYVKWTMYPFHTHRICNASKPKKTQYSQCNVCFPVRGKSRDRVIGKACLDMGCNYEVNARSAGTYRAISMTILDHHMCSINAISSMDTHTDLEKTHVKLSSFSAEPNDVIAPLCASATAHTALTKSLTSLKCRIMSIFVKSNPDYSQH